MNNNHHRQRSLDTRVHLRPIVRSVLATLRSLRHGAPTLVELTTDWNQVIGKAGIGITARTASKAVLDRFTAVTCRVAGAWSAAKVTC
jgi:hypothetical protein